MTFAKDIKLGRQESYQARAGAARMLGKLLFMVLLGTTSYAAWSEPKIKVQLESGLATLGPIASGWINRSGASSADQTAQLETNTPDVTINRP